MESVVEHFKLPGISSKVSRLGLGGCPLGGHGWGDFSERSAIAAVRKALDYGINFFDTADIYGLGQSEKLLSKSLGIHRHKTVIASKGGVRRNASGKVSYDNSSSWLRSALESTLRRLKIECVPLYYIHWLDEATPIEEVVLTLLRFKDEGKIRGIGLSNVSADKLKRAQAVAQISAIQIQYSLLDRKLAEELLPLAKILGIPLITWGSLSQGLLSGKINKSTKFRQDDRRNRYLNFQGERFVKSFDVINQLSITASEEGKTVAQTAMRWLLEQDGVGAVLFGSKKPEQVFENVGAMGWKLSKKRAIALGSLVDESFRDTPKAVA